MNRRNLAGPLAFLALAVVGTIVSLAARADGFWEKKEWKQWSKEDVHRMLHDSPWARKFSVGKSIVANGLPSNTGAASRGAAGETREEIDYYFTLRSALPIREALVRDEEIRKKYDKMTDAEKKDFDARQQANLNREYTAEIWVHVDYSANLQNFERALAVYWQSLAEHSVPLDFFIITERGDHVGPVRFISPKSGATEFDILFPRMFNNEPTIKDSDKTFTIQFPHPPIYDLPRARGYVAFNAEKMMFNGRLTY
jgi:hypothetical protein